MWNQCKIIYYCIIILFLEKTSTVGLVHNLVLVNMPQKSCFYNMNPEVFHFNWAYVMLTVWDCRFIFMVHLLVDFWHKYLLNTAPGEWSPWSYQILFLRHTSLLLPCRGLQCMYFECLLPRLIMYYKVIICCVRIWDLLSFESSYFNGISICYLLTQGLCFHCILSLMW